MYLRCCNMQFFQKNNKRKEREVIGRKNWLSEVFITFVNIVRDGTRIEEEFKPSWCQEKIKGLWKNATILYLDEDEEKNEGFWKNKWGMVGSCRGIFYKGVGKKIGLA